ncbi:MAG: hypothetical protein M1281_00085 [Chloroflexi bacterium]|nr:hypothetical protein [Chloroflexota bacterium]
MDPRFLAGIAGLISRLDALDDMKEAQDLKKELEGAGNVGLGYTPSIWAYHSAMEIENKIDELERKKRFSLSDLPDHPWDGDGENDRNRSITIDNELDPKNWQWRHASTFEQGFDVILLDRWSGDKKILLENIHQTDAIMIKFRYFNHLSELEKYWKSTPYRVRSLRIEVEPHKEIKAEPQSKRNKRKRK